MLKDVNTEKLSIEIAGENALIIYFSDCVNDETTAKVKQAECIIRQAMQAELALDIIDLIPSYASILVVFNMLNTDHHHIRNKLRVLLHSVTNNLDINNEQANQVVVELPVYYSHESGPDLTVIAKRNRLTVNEVIQIHQSIQYTVYAIGFAPGFAYLGEVDDRVASPRLNTPRLKVPKGAVAIADKQTAVYPNTSPGGWNIIGLCPINMFDANANPIMPVKVGDKVKFTAINKNEFLAMGGKLEHVLGNSV